MRRAFLTVFLIMLWLPLPGAVAARRKDVAPHPSSQLVSARTSGDKDGFGTAYTYGGTGSRKASRVWFTLGGGALNETYYPTLDTTATNRMSFAVTDGKHWLVNEVGNFTPTVTFLAPRSLSYHVVSVNPAHHVTITKDVVTDPAHDTVMMRVLMTAPKGSHLYVHLEPALDNTSVGGRVRVTRNLVESWKPHLALALVTSGKWGNHSANYRLVNDGLQQLTRKHRLTTAYTLAGPGRVAATIGLPSKVTVALGFGASTNAAATAARASLREGFDAVQSAYVAGWQQYAGTLDSLGGKADDRYYATAESIKAAEDKTTSGAIVASPTHPFGQEQEDDSANYGYGAVWPRDLYHSAMGLLAAGDTTTANEALNFMAKIQDSTGGWPRNASVGGTPYAGGEQLDEVADPILLAWRLQRTDLYLSMVKRAADFIVVNGPSTPIERWEENGGYSPSTIAAEIAALVAAADMASRQGDTTSQARYLKAADSWQRQIDAWTYTTSGPLGNHQYYLRLSGGDPNAASILSIANGGGDYDQRTIVDGGFLELVRLGVKSARDPHVLATLPVNDTVLKSTTTKGPAFYRYNHDGYGDPPAGSSANAGHPWPVLAGERGMYDLIAGDMAGAQAILDALRGFGGSTALVPEQVLEGSGNPTTSARPLSWAQGEYLVLQRSLADGKPFDLPSIVAQHFGNG